MRTFLAAGLAAPTSNVVILPDADASDTLTPQEAAIPAELFAAKDTGREGLASRAEYDRQALADFRAADLDADGLPN